MSHNQATEAGRVSWKISPTAVLGQSTAQSASHGPASASAGVGLLCARAADGSVEVRLCVCVGLNRMQQSPVQACSRIRDLLQPMVGPANHLPTIGTHLVSCRAV